MKWLKVMLIATKWKLWAKKLMLWKKFHSVRAARHADVAGAHGVDDAIVMIENIHREMEAGVKPMRAALEARLEHMRAFFRAALAADRP